MAPLSSNGVTRMGTTPLILLSVMSQREKWNISSTGSITGEVSGLVSM